MNCGSIIIWGIKFQKLSTTTSVKKHYSMKTTSTELSYYKSAHIHTHTQKQIHTHTHTYTHIHPHIVPKLGREQLLSLLHDGLPEILKMKGLVCSYIWWWHMYWCGYWSSSEEIQSILVKSFISSHCATAPLWMAGISMGAYSHWLHRTVHG